MSRLLYGVFLILLFFTQQSFADPHKDNLLNIPVVSAVSPNAGPLDGGTKVTITGTGFANITGVTFGSKPATSFTVVSTTKITAVSPAGSGSVNIQVTASDGTSAINGNTLFTYVPRPTVTAISPNLGLMTGGTVVTITGTNFTGAKAVKFSASSALSFTVDSDTQITAISPPASNGSVLDVNVTTAGGQSLFTPADKFTYVKAAVVTGIQPIRGPESGGTTVIINGSSFEKGTSVNSVTFGGVPALSFKVIDDTQISAVSPAGRGAVDIVVTTIAGATPTTPADVFTYIPRPIISNIAPSMGTIAGGTAVTITGMNLNEATAVLFGSVPASSYTIINNNQIIAVSPPGSDTVDITVTTPGGTSLTNVNDEFTYRGAPIINSIAPTQGSALGGTTVIINGSNFIGATAVKFGAVVASAYSIISDSQISAVSPPGNGSVDITITTDEGVSDTTAADVFTYIQVPILTNITPTAGPEAGGTSVIITGSNFTGATSVMFGGQPASSFTIDSANQITAISPSGAGVVDITITTIGGISATNSSSKFTYLPLPQINQISPINGPDGGGTMVTISGQHFSNATAVLFGNTPATSFTVVNDSQITAVAPAGEGQVNIFVTTVGGTSIASNNSLFTYLNIPVITNITPTSGLMTGGTTVTLNGRNFNGTTTVRFGTTLATSFKVINDNQITAVSPPGTAGNIVDITVTTPLGTSPKTSADKYTYIAPPVVSSISPTNGPTSGGTTVTINGANFSGASPVTAVYFGTTPAVSFKIVSNTKVTAVSPSGSGTVDITITTKAGVSGKTSADQFTYVTAPTVTALNPNKGPTGGGNTVEITGTNFNNATTVKFGNLAATSFTVVSSTKITAVAPPGTGTVNVTVVTPGGSSAPSNANIYTYIAIPIVSNVIPSNGPPTGGTTVSIFGFNFLNVSAVKFGNVAATSYTVIDDTQITAVSPAGSGTVDIKVTALGGTNSSDKANKFTYLTTTRILNVAPAVGTIAGGTQVTLSGNNFTNVTQVSFGNTPATSYTVVNKNKIIAVAPAGREGVVDIVVTTSTGASLKELSDQYTYVTGLNGIFVGAQNGNVYYSIDNGANWVNAAPLDGSAVTSLYALSNTVYAGTQAGKIYVSSNNGGSWIAIPHPDGISPVNALFVFGNTLYAGIGNGRIYSTTNNGVNWTAMGAPDSGLSPIQSLFVVSTTNLYAGTDNGRVYYSANSGNSWNAINGTPDGTAINSIYLSNGNLYVSTANEYVYLTKLLTGGGTWGQPIAQMVYSLYISPDGNIMYVATQGGHVFSLSNSAELGFVTDSRLTSIAVTPTL